ncbi:LapA family protein [Brevibacterium casei]
MSSQDPRGRAQTPDELLAETESLLGGDPGQSPGQSPGEAVGGPGAGGTGGGGSVEHREDAPVRGGGAPGRNGGMSAGMWFSLILGAVIVVLLLIFILQNNVPAQFQYFGWQFQLPLGVAMLFAAIGGILVAGIIGSVRIFVLGRKLKKIEKAAR